MSKLEDELASMKSSLVASTKSSILQSPQIKKSTFMSSGNDLSQIFGTRGRII